MDIGAWEESGLYRPNAPGADERRALLEYLTARGATLEQMVEAHRRGGLPVVAGDLVVGTEPATMSVEELAARCGVSVERLQRVLLAMGLPLAPDTKLPGDLDSLMAAFEQGVALMGEDAILAFTRVLGAAATNIAEAAVALFYAELGPGTGREGSDELARARVSETATRAFTTVPGVLSRLLLAQFERAARRAVLTRDWSAPTGAESDAAAAAGPSEVVALGFVDMVGSTQWAEGLSLRDHSLALSRFGSAAWSSAVHAGGRAGFLALYTALLAAVFATVADVGLGALTGDPGYLFLIFWAYATAVCFAIAGIAARLGMAVALLVIVTIVILGNTSAGGPVGRPLLNSFYAALTPIFPQGAGLTMVRGTAYFGGHGIATAAPTLAVWGGIGPVLLAAAAVRYQRSRREV